MITFHSEEIDFTLEDEAEVRAWISLEMAKYQREVESISYIFCSDEYLLDINREYLGHDYFTDIITFPLHEEGSPIFSDVFISIDRVRENADELGVSFRDELHRVIIHGVLHLMGMADALEDEKMKMRKAEDAALQARTF